MFLFVVLLFFLTFAQHLVKFIHPFFFMSSTFYTIVAIYAILNIIAFAVFGFDKRQYKHDETRVPKAVFFVIAAIGGSLGATIGMHFYRHKLYHKDYYLAMPTFLLVHVIMAIFLLNKYL